MNFKETLEAYGKWLEEAEDSAEDLLHLIKQCEWQLNEWREIIQSIEAGN